MQDGPGIKWDFDDEFNLTHSFPTAKQLFNPDFLRFSVVFLNFQDLNTIAMANSHLVLHKQTLKQYFEK